MVTHWAAGEPIPAAAVPVPAQVCGIDRHDDDVACPGWDVTIAARADVGLRSLVWLDRSDLEVPEYARVLHRYPRNAQATNARPTRMAVAT